MLDQIGANSLDNSRKIGGGPRHVDRVEKPELAGVDAISKRETSLEQQIQWIAGARVVDHRPSLFTNR
jgi:hypothetical protein